MSSFGASVSYTIDSDYLKSLASNARVSKDAVAFIKFENLPLIEEISQKQIISIGTEQGYIESGAFGNALHLRPKSSYIYEGNLKSFYELSVGFWLLPFYVNPTINQSTGIAQYYRQPLVDKSMYYFDTPSSYILTEKDSFSMFEESIDNERNVMKISIRGTNGSLAILSSESYSTGEFHYFWLSYNGPSNICKFYIDGKEVSLTLEEGISIPHKINSIPTTPFHINLSAIGQSSLIRGNSGIIDELIIMSKSNFDERSIGRHINLGTEFVINNALMTRDEVNIGFGFDDPTALTVNSVYSNGKNLYLGRSDGKIFKGDRLIWQARKDFSLKEELNYVRKNILGDNALIEIDNGSLKIQKASIRI